MGAKWYALFFAVSTIIATGILLPGVQANSIGNAAELALGGGEIVDTVFGPLSSTKITTSIFVLILLAFIIFGGVKRIASFTQVVVPFMALAYIVISLSIIGLNVNRLPEIITLIINDAFTPMAGFGAAIGWGVRRGIYSNEAGQGTGPHAAAAAEVSHPAQQGLVQAFSVYIDTLFVCTATAFMILITGSYNVHGKGSDFIIQNISSTVDANSPAFTQYALEATIPGMGAPFIAVALFFFAFTTILAYYYIAETNIAYLRRSFKLPGDMIILKLFMLGSVFYGSVKTASVAWGLGDVGVGIMAWLNIIGILIIFFMSKPAIKALEDYEAQKSKGVKEYTFDPNSLQINNAIFWENRKRNSD
jgi:AGCS family alanine or glycine:cation symporter